MTLSPYKAFGTPFLSNCNQRNQFPETMQSIKGAFMADSAVLCSRIFSRLSSGQPPRLIIAGSRKSESWWGNPRSDRYRQLYCIVGNTPARALDVQATPRHWAWRHSRRHPMTSGCHSVYNSPHCAASPSVDPENLN